MNTQLFFTTISSNALGIDMYGLNEEDFINIERNLSEILESYNTKITNITGNKEKLELLYEFQDDLEEEQVMDIIERLGTR